MTTEEKAKAYDEALERAKPLFDSCVNILCEVSPELVESKDENIRKSIVDCVSWFGMDSDMFANHDVTKVQVLSYLEKQKEKAAIPDELVKAYKEFGEKIGEDCRALINAIQWWNKQKEQKPAEWMAAQGETVKATVFKQNNSGYFANGTAYLEEAYNMKRALGTFNDGDEVEVQIRKVEL